MKTAHLCQAFRCKSDPVPGHDLCGYHLEAEEEGQAVLRKTPPKRRKADAGRNPGHSARKRRGLFALPRREQREALKVIIRESLKTKSSAQPARTPRATKEPAT